MVDAVRGFPREGAALLRLHAAQLPAGVRGFLSLAGKRGTLAARTRGTRPPRAPRFRDRGAAALRPAPAPQPRFGPADVFQILDPPWPSVCEPARRCAAAQARKTPAQISHRGANEAPPHRSAAAARK